MGSATAAKVISVLVGALGGRLARVTAVPSARRSTLERFAPGGRPEPSELRQCPLASLLNDRVVRCIDCRGQLVEPAGLYERDRSVKVVDGRLRPLEDRPSTLPGQPAERVTHPRVGVIAPGISVGIVAATGGPSGRVPVPVPTAGSVVRHAPVWSRHQI